MVLQKKPRTVQKRMECRLSKNSMLIKHHALSTLAKSFGKIVTYIVSFLLSFLKVLTLKRAPGFCPCFFSFGSNAIGKLVLRTASKISSECTYGFYFCIFLLTGIVLG